jgi:hypothetical protein
MAMRLEMLVVLLGSAMAAAIAYNGDHFRRETQALRDRRDVLANQPKTYDYADSHALLDEFYDEVGSFGTAEEVDDVLFLVMPSDADFNRRLRQWLDEAVRSGFRGEIRVVSAGYDDASPFSIEPPTGSRVRFLRIRDVMMFSRLTGIKRLPFAMLSRDSVVQSVMVGNFSEDVAAGFLNRPRNARDAKLFETPTGILQTVPGEFAEAKR